MTLLKLLSEKDRHNVLVYLLQAYLIYVHRIKVILYTMFVHFKLLMLQYVCVCMCVCLLYMCVCVCVCMCVCVCVCVCVHVCVYMCVCV